jgi:hypothetical protein
MSYNQLFQILPKAIEDLIYEYNPEHRELMKPVLLSILSMPYKMFKYAKTIRIDNQMVEMIGGGCRVSSIKLFQRQHHVILNLATVPYVTTGSRRLDSLLIQRIMDGIERFDDLNVIYPISRYRSLDFIVI